jgi:tetratricopeptide (TPR) repeat protein
MKKALFAGTLASIALMAGFPAEARYRIGRQAQLDMAGQLTYTGWNLSAQEAKDLEDQLKEEPANTEVRTVVLGYYNRVSSAEDMKASMKDKVRHITFLVSSQPWAPILDTHYVTLFKFLNPDEYDSIKNLWLKAVKGSKVDARVLGNAAAFLKEEDKKLAVELLEKAVVLEPGDPYWRRTLAPLYRSRAENATPDEKAGLLRKAITEYERALPLEKGYHLGTVRIELAETAFEARDARQALQMARVILTDTTTGIAKYFAYRANMLMARISLADQDKGTMWSHVNKAIEAAKKPDAGQTLPNLVFPEELQNKGDKQGAVEYLKMCEGLWPDKANLLKDWSIQIRSGKTPDFSKWWSSQYSSTVMSTP